MSLFRGFLQSTSEEGFILVTCPKRSEIHSEMTDYSAIAKVESANLPSVAYNGPERDFPFSTHGVSVRGKWLDDIMGLPSPLFPYLPRFILSGIWSARCYTAREFESILRKNGFIPERLVFLMPAFDGVSPAMSAMPVRIREFAQKVSSRADCRQFSWFGSSIAVMARKN